MKSMVFLAGWFVLLLLVEMMYLVGVYLARNQGVAEVVGMMMEGVEMMAMVVMEWGNGWG